MKHVRVDGKLVETRLTVERVANELSMKREEAPRSLGSQTRTAPQRSRK